MPEVSRRVEPAKADIYRRTNQSSVKAAIALIGRGLETAALMRDGQVPRLLLEDDLRRFSRPSKPQEQESRRIVIFSGEARPVLPYMEEVGRCRRRHGSKSVTPPPASTGWPAPVPVLPGVSRETEARALPRNKRRHSSFLLSRHDTDHTFSTSQLRSRQNAEQRGRKSGCQ